MIRLVAKCWKNGGKSGSQGPGGFFNKWKLFFSIVKTLPNKLGLVSNWHTNSKNLRLVAKRWNIGGKSRAPGPGGLFNHRKLFLRTVKTLSSKLGLVSSWHTNSINCCKGCYGAVGTVALEQRRKMTYSLTSQYYRELCNIRKRLLPFPVLHKLV